MGFSVWADGSYDAALIDDELRKNAYVVNRVDVTEIEVQSESRIIVRVKKAVTVLDEKGLDAAAMVVDYDKFTKILNLSAVVYDENGKQIQRIKGKEFADVSYSASSLATDTRLKAFRPSPGNRISLPFTIEYQYEQQINGLFSIPRWIPMDSENLAIEFAALKVNVPQDGYINHRSQNLDFQVEKGYHEGHYRYYWEIRSLPALEREPMSPSFREQIPMVHVAPKSFNIQGFSGTANDWNELGNFFYRLNDGRQSLPEELKRKVDEITYGLEDPMAKAQALYEFMQQNTRYVSIQLGIGGWQTFDADYVYRNGYGDCKALTNYMKSMLQYLDIPSYGALVYAGENEPDIITDFPANQFNHIILCIPQESDTTWLECTSSFAPFGYLGDFTEARHVLLLTPSGGHLVKTPGSTPEMNQQFRLTEVQLDERGNAQVKVSTTCTGFQQTALRYHAEEASEREREKYIRKRIDAGSFDLENYSLSAIENQAVPTYQLQYELNAPNWAKASGPRLFLTPNVLEQYTFVPEKNEDRQQSILLNYAYLDRDTVIYHLPQGYEIESMDRDPIKIETIFGTYTAKLESVDPTTLRYCRELKMEKMELPPSHYESIREFYKAINQADRIRVVLSNRS